MEDVEMPNDNRWVIGAIAIIWIVVLITSWQSDSLRFGDDPVEIPIAALANWFWGLAGTVYVLRATIFRRPTEPGWGEDTSWPWVALGVGVIWVVALIVSITFPNVVIDDGFVDIPLGAVAAPIIAVALTSYVTDFLVTGFAARNAGRFKRLATEGTLADETPEPESEYFYQPEYSEED